MREAVICVFDGFVVLPSVDRDDAVGYLIWSSVSLALSSRRVSRLLQQRVRLPRLLHSYD